MALRDEQRAWLILLRTPGIGAATLRTLIEAAGTPIAALERLRDGTSIAGFRPDAAASRWLRTPDATRLEADLAWLEAPGHHLLACTDPTYPPLLAEGAHAPAVLFIDGDPDLLLQPQLAVVGARNASPSGRDNARAFAAALAEAGLVITSGLAEGIDAAAHQAALDAGRPTLAVMGTGPNGIYPARHRALAGRIAVHGALITEFPPDTPARPGHFPSRNRIIAGMTLGTLVIEAGLRSGSLITARLATEQGREVFALPGSIHHPLARGCHRLIRDGARLVETAGEIHEALAPLARALGVALTRRLREHASDGDRPTPGADAAQPPSDDPDYRRLLAALDHEPVSLDRLVQRSGLPAASVSSMLLMLELQGRVESQPGGRFRRSG